MYNMFTFINVFYFINMFLLTKYGQNFLLFF